MNENIYSGLWRNLLKSKTISLDEDSIALLQNIFKPKLYFHELRKWFNL